MIIETVCPFCGKEGAVKVKMYDWLNYVNGTLAQNAFPYLSTAEREQIISNMCPACQASIFGGDDE